MENFLWRTFENSGDINLYLAFKNMQDVSHKNILINVSSNNQLTNTSDSAVDMTL